ncbi:MAG: outer membrane beta-barrel protein, partial [Dysgonamonadaceae bacterium]|jgi:hypothetical protein|nr:outer membrane beta-barrel protein [Dysgonamonadaceae bacterium]
VSGEDGLFLFDKVESGRYFIKISYLGLDDKFMPFEILTESIDLGVITLKESDMSLSEVVITARTPPFKLSENGGIIANVSTTRLSTVGTANDVLQRMPGITADNGKISVFGKGTPVVYINNRKVQDISELERLESAEISTVELINNPGAKYDAEGRAVLLIKTKAKTEGFSAQITERLRQGKYLGDNENVNISFTKNKLNLFTTLYHNYNKQETIENHKYELINTEGLWQHFTFLPGYWYSNNSQQINTGFDYSINDMHAIGGQYQFYSQHHEDLTPIKTITNFNKIQNETSHSSSNSKGNDYQHLVNAFYNGNLHKQFSLRLDFDYLNNHDYQEQLSNETINESETRFVEIFNQTDYDLYATKLTNSYKSNVGLIEFGGEYNYIYGSGFVHGNGTTNDSEFSNEEEKAAGFINYSNTFSNINVVTGLRYEYTSEFFTEGINKNPIIEKHYGDWYPNISVSGKIKNIDMSLAFNKRTQRPTFSQLNGNVIYINRFVFQKGNPYLNKTNIYDVNFQATMNPFYLNIGYMYSKNPVLLFFEEQNNNDNAILCTYSNFPEYKVMYASFNWNTEISFWQPNYTINIGKPNFSAKYDGKIIGYNMLNYSLRAFNDFILPFGLVLSCNYRFQSDEQNSFFESKKYQRLDLGIRKSFFNNSLRCNLTVFDVFNWVKEKNHMQLNNIAWDADKKYETRYATLSITYMFNNYQKKYRGENAAKEDLNRF